MIKKIITHPGQAHLDEFLACCVALAQHENAEIVRREPSEEELADRSILVLDVGGQYDPLKNNFDHHHNASLPCAFVLYFTAAMNCSVEDLFEVFRWAENLNLRDTQGFPAVARKYNLAPAQLQEFGSPIDGIILSMFADKDMISPQNALHLIMREIGFNLIGAFKKFRADEKQCWIHHEDGIRIVVTKKKKNIAKFAVARKAGAAVVIAPNERGEGFTITRVDDHPMIDCKRLEQYMPSPVSFIHQTGFLAVIEESFDRWPVWVKKVIVK